MLSFNFAETTSREKRARRVKKTKKPASPKEEVLVVEE